MRARRCSWRGAVALLGLVSYGCASQPPTTGGDDNGIYVDAKVYDNHTLELQLRTLSARLGQISGIDQASLISRLGSLQGASATQTAAAFQALEGASPSVGTTSLNATPSVAQTVGTTTTSGTPSIAQTLGATTSAATPSVVQTNNIGSTVTPTATSTSNSTQTVTTTVSNTAGTTSQTITTTPSTTTASNNQTVTTTPSNTLQTVTTTPSVTPSVPTLPSTTPFALPSAFSTSALDTLNEQMQLSYQIINLQLLLQGALSDEYTEQGLGKRRVTFGFPIYITTPRRYKNDVAEVEVSVCNPEGSLDKTDPTLQTIIPQEKTYNVASIVSKGVSLGAGAVVANVVNIGANYSWTHQTYYVVKEQDTVALQRASAVSAAPCPTNGRPLTFAWQFRPVLGQKTVDQGLRSTFAQISFAPSSNAPGSSLKAQLSFRTCWRKFDQKTGIVGDIIPFSCRPAVNQTSRAREIATYFDTLRVDSIREHDNGDGTMTTIVGGSFPVATRVGLGETYLDESIAGFENSGQSLRFTAPLQVLALRGARLLSPDGSIKDVVLAGVDDEPSNFNPKDNVTFVPGDFPDGTVPTDRGAPLGFRYERVFTGFLLKVPKDFDAHLVFVRPRPYSSRCSLPGVQGSDRQLSAVVTPFSDNLVKVTVPLWQCIEIGPIGKPAARVVVLNGRVFGLSDAPFLSFSPTELSFLAPKTLLQGQTTLTLKRLFFDERYQTSYRLVPSNVSVTGISVLSTTGGDTTFLLTGSGLTDAKLAVPDHPTPRCCRTYMKITLSSDELASVKELVLQPNDQSAPFLITLPALAKPSEDPTDTKARYPISILEKTNEDTTYAITARKGSPPLTGAKFLTPVGHLPKVVQQDDTNLWFSLPVAQVSSAKEVALLLTSGDPRVIIVSLPTPPKAEDDGSSSKLTLTADKTGIKQGSTGPYTIKGSNLKLIASIRYLGSQLPVHFSTESVTIDQLPPSLSATPGTARLEVRLTDGTKQTYDVLVTK
jgi:hypothetical protein